MQLLAIPILVGGAAAQGAPVAATAVTFSPGVSVFAGPMAGRPVLADMDRDGDLDVVLACGTCCGSRPDPRSGKVVVLENDGSGRLRPLADAVVIGPSARKIAVGDLDGDGLPDVAVAEHDTYAVHLLQNLGGGRLVAFADSPVAAAVGARPHTHEIALADLDGDRVLDVLTTNANDHAISVLRGDGKGRMAPVPGSPFATVARHPYDALAIADFDGDGDVDVVVPLLRDGRLALLRGRGDGALSGDAADLVVVSARPGYVLAADVDRDGDVDVLGSHDDTGVLDVLINDGRGHFAAGGVELSQPIWGLAAADLDGDGDLDLVCGAQNGADVQLLRGDGRGGFVAWQSLTAGRQANHVAVGDLDHDGRADIVASCYGTGELFAFLAAAAKQ